MEPAPPRLFLIEADPARRAGMLSALSAAGHPARAYSSREEALAALGGGEAEDRYEMLFTRTLDGFALHEMLFDQQGRPCDSRFLAVNPAFERLTGIPAGAIVGKRLLEVFPGTDPPWIETFGQVVLSGEPVKFEEFHTPLGKWFEVLAFRPREGQFACVFRDITDRKRQEAEIVKLNRLYAVLSQVNQAVARARAQDELFQTICQVAADFGHFRMTWIGVAQAGGALRVAALKGDTERFPHALDHADCGLARAAIGGNRPLLCNRISPEQPGEGCYAFARDAGIGSCAAFPLHLRGGVYGVLCLYAAEADFFSPSEVHLLEEVAMDISFALDRFADDEDRARAERALRESEERFSIAFFKAPVMMSIRSIEDGTYLEVNEKFEAVSGFRREEVLGKTAVEIGWLTPEEHERFLRAFREQGRLTNLELTPRAKDGRRVVCSYDMAPVTIGGVPRLLTIAVDVTYRKLYEAERETMLQLLRILNAPNDTRGLLHMVTGFLQEWSGCEAVGIRLADGSDFPYSETRGFPAGFVESEKRLCGAGGAGLECLCGATIEGRLDPGLEQVTANGSFWTNSTEDFLAATGPARLPPHWRGRCLRDGYQSLALIPLHFGGKTIGLLQCNDRARGKFTPEMIGLLERAAGSLATALEQRRTQEELRQSEERYRRLYLDSPLGYQSLDAEGRLADVNPAWLDTLGYSREEVLGRWFGEFLDGPAEVERFREQFSRFKESGEAHKEYAMRRKDGSRVIIGFDGKAGRDAAGRFLRTHCILHDVTERRRSEHERAQLTEQLQRAQRLESVGRLAGGLAHDFNNLLTVINGYADLLLSRLNPADPLRKPLEEIRKSGGRAASLTQQLLAFSRKQVIEPKPLDLNQLVAEDGDMLRRLVGEDIELITALDPSIGPVMADRGQLNQVLMNLVVNAHDAMPDGGKLTIETSAVRLDGGAEHASGLAPGEYVRLTVTDTGVGMDKEVLERIFDPFFTTKGEGKGTGLGLATVYGIVRQSGGRIWVYSEPGRGTTFKIDLPCAGAPTTGETAQAAIEGSLTGSETILVVEDQAQVRTLTVEILKGYGYRVLEAGMGGEALLLAQRHAGPIHLMLTDVVMPSMTGRELAGRLKAVRPKMAVLYMSGYSENAITREGTLEPGVSYISKPFSPRELAAKVREVLGRAAPAGKVLVTDDDESVRGFFRGVLAGAGYEVVEARDGDEALELARVHSPDLVLIDLVMPNREGIETIPALRKNHPGMKIVAVSGAFGGSFLRAAAMMGADATVLKPVTPERLLETVRRLLD